MTAVRPRTGLLLFLACLTMIAGGCTVVRNGGAAADPEYITPFGPPTGPFTPAVRHGNTLYLSGQLGTDSTGLVPGGISAETRQALENIRAVLEASGSSLDRVVKCTVMMLDMAEWPAMNVVYRTYFTSHYPARSAYGVTALALGARVEIECLAAAD